MIKLMMIMAALIDFADYPTTELPSSNGNKLTVAFFGHASLAISCNDKVIYIDPVGAEADYAKLPKADVVLITHNHGDHFDAEALKRVRTDKTEVIADPTTAESIKDVKVMRNGDETIVGDWLKVEAVAAYNTTEGRDRFHPKGRDNGYVITLGGERVYICGDSEPTPEMLSLKNIDYAFLPVNQPYTMTVEQAVEAVKALHPKIFFPYHFGGTDTRTDMTLLRKEVEKAGIRIEIVKQME